MMRRPKIRLSTFLRRVGMLVGLVLVLAVGRYGYWTVAQNRFTAVTAHQLYQSGQMPPDRLLSVSKKHGIRTVIDLRTAEDAEAIEAERLALADSDLTYIHLPMRHDPAEETVLAFLEIVGDPANRPVLVHCHHGTGRSVLLSSVFRIEFENWDNETARRAVEPLHWRGNFVPGAPKGRYVLSYRPHRTRVLFDSGET